MRKVLVTAVVCSLVFAGGAAASGYLITSVHQIKPSVRRALKGNRGARGRAGAAGAKGAAGAAGAAGAPGGFSTANVTEVSGVVAFMCANGGGACSANASVASCPAGGVVLGGGWEGDTPSPEETVAQNEPTGNGTAWDVVMANNAAISASFHAVAVCATGSGATIAHLVSRRDLQAIVARQIAAVRAQQRAR